METKVPTTNQPEPTTPAIIVDDKPVLEPLNETADVTDAKILMESDIIWIKSWIMDQMKNDTSMKFKIFRGTRSSGSGAGSTTFTTEFEPKFIRVSSSNGTDAVCSWGAWNGMGTDICIGTTDSGDTSILYIYSGGLKSRAVISAADSKGFTLTWSANTVNNNYLIEAFG